jgi:hypothetical protein
VLRKLSAAGFRNTTFTDFREPVYYGSDVATALEWIRGFACTNKVMRFLVGASAEHTLERLRATLGTPRGPRRCLVQCLSLGRGDSTPLGLVHPPSKESSSSPTEGDQSQ